MQDETERRGQPTGPGRASRSPGAGATTRRNRWARLRRSLWQPPRPHGEQPRERVVGALELFYDLATVVLVAQAAHHLARHLTWGGLGEFAVVFTLVWGERRLRYKVRHRWKYGSVFNATHPIEVGWQRGDSDFDVGLGGHTHIGTVERAFWRHRQRRLAVLTGTYKVLDTYGRELGLPAPMHRGSGAHVFHGGRLRFCHDLEEARNLLERLT